MSVALRKKLEHAAYIVTFGSVYMDTHWIVAWNECQAWVEELITFIRNKPRFYQRVLRAMTLIQQAL